MDVSTLVLLYKVKQVYLSIRLVQRSNFPGKLVNERIKHWISGTPSPAEVLSLCQRRLVAEATCHGSVISVHQTAGGDVMEEFAAAAVEQTCSGCKALRPTLWMTCCPS